MSSLLSKSFWGGLLLSYFYWSAVAIWPHFPVTRLSCVDSSSSPPSNSADTSQVVVQSPSCVRLFATHRLQHARPLCPSPSPHICPSSCALHQWCHPAILSSDALFSFCPQSFPGSGTFPMSQMTKILGVSASASVFPMSIQGWFPLRLTSLISLQSKGLSGVFSNTTVRRHQFFDILPSLQSSSHSHMWPLGRP